ncbi:hypothetical protein EC968_002879 [Mortierella alpina]|nr:hypothetical protein EC968_002879 [Mortierella alpina]
MEALRTKNDSRGQGRLSSRSARQPPLLKREESDIIPTSIPTQEVLQNLGRYRSSRSGDVEEEQGHDSSSPELPPSPELPRSPPIRQRPPLVLSSPTRKARTAPLPPAPLATAVEDDPIMDFDDDDEENLSNMKQETGVMDDSIQTLSVGSFSSLSSDPQQNVSENAHSVVPPPQSPTGKFILPAISYQAARSVHIPPPSPSKRLRPVSEVPQPIAPAHLQQQTPTSPRRGHGSPSRRQPKVRRTNAIQPVIPKPAIARSPTTPTRRVSDIGKSLRVLQPPAPLGPRLLEIAAEERLMQEEQEEQRELYHVHKQKHHRTRQMAQQTGTDLRLPASPAFDVSPFCESSSTSTASTKEPIKVKKEEPLTQSHLLRVIDEPQPDPDIAEPHVTDQQPRTPSPVVLPELILEHATKLTPIDRIKWSPAKEGRFHIFGLILSVSPVEQMMNKTGPQAGQTYGKRLITMCDQSATSFKVFLWRDRCGWGDHFKPGDAVLFTDMQTKEFRNKVSANSSSWSKMSRLDGSLLLSYVGNSIIESFLKTFDHQRQVLGIHLLDKESGIVSEPSLYITQPLELLQEPFTSTGVGSASGLGQGAGTRLKKSFTPILPPSFTGTSIRGSVIYKMLIEPEDHNGWEVGVVMADGRLATRSSLDQRHSARKINELLWKVIPLLLIFLQTRVAYLYSVLGVVGNATLSGYILAARFPNVSSNDNGESCGELFGPIQSYCTGCSSTAVSSPQNPSILFCPHCHLDPQRRAQSTLEWMYPTFELAIGDKPRLGGNLSNQSLQVRCQLRVGDQVFPSVPARSWMENEEGFWKAKKRWQKLVDLMNGDDESGERRPCQKVRVELKVGVGMVTKALKVEYL